MPESADWAYHGPSILSTIKDVAARAGVSFATVSHVLNGTRPVSESARRRVEQAVNDLGYVPSALARALKTNQTRMLGVLVPNIVNPYFSELMRGIEDRCRRAGYAVFLCNCDDDLQRQTHYVQTLLQRRVDGLLLAVATGEASELEQVLSHVRTPVVVVERALPGHHNDLVRVDNTAGARLAVQHLLALGHRRIACLAGPARFEVSRARMAGWHQALTAAGIQPRAEWLLEGDFSIADGHRLTHQLLAQGGISALFASNDLFAVGALRAAAERGLTVPRDLSVIGFDGIDLGPYLHPALSSVGYPIRELGERAASVLIERITRPGTPTREVVLSPQLILRESTARALHA